MTDTIPKSEVARVLARLYSVSEPEPLHDLFHAGIIHAVGLISLDLWLGPEFESALKALEAKYDPR